MFFRKKIGPNILYKEGKLIFLKVIVNSTE